VGPCCRVFVSLHIHPAPQHMDRHTMSHDAVRGLQALDLTPAMQDLGYGLPRISLLGTSVNRLYWIGALAEIHRRFISGWFHIRSERNHAGQREVRM
jgi:hypothetical protein